ncbi:MAG: phenylalanine--tRNA ligase subunit beta [Planctomycetota bacterium]
MLISYRWLGRHVDLDGLSPEEVARSLTIHTAEVEGLTPFAPALADVVVGQVVEREPHADADSLSVCRVDIGDGDALQIVCGAPNVRAGLRVAVARVGTVLPGGLKLGKAKIRGVESRGMICSERELGLGDEHDGIWELPGAPDLGASVADALGLRDWVIEIDNKSLTHRPDLWGHRGIAGELAAIHGRELRPLDSSALPTGAGAAYPVRVESGSCPRYFALPIDGLANGRSPEWLRHLLLAVGQRPLDLLVDISNFVMLDIAQPNHLFDRRRLAPEGIVVRNARAGETMQSLDGVERRLDADDMLITSGDQPVAIAGVMGGLASKVGDDTSELLLEVASFHPTTVRRTAQRLGLRTDASTRFEKYLDPTLPERAAWHMVRLLKELQPGLVLPAPPGDAGTWTDPACTVRLRPARVRAVLGKAIDDAEIERTLTRLGLRPTRVGDHWDVAVPSARATKDIGIEEDLIEEVGRIHGYDELPEAALVVALEPPRRDERRSIVRTLTDRLAGGARFFEAMTHTFQSDDLLATLGLLDGSHDGPHVAPHVAVVNPVVEGTSRIRRDVLPSLVGVLEPNRRRLTDVRLFEIGKGYRPEDTNDRGEPREVHQLALVWARRRSSEPEPFDATIESELDGVVRDALAAIGIRFAGWSKGAPDAAPAWAHPRRWAECPGEPDPLARLGTLDPRLAKRLGLEGELASDVACATISIDACLTSERHTTRYAAAPRFPSVKVDVALAVPEHVACRDVEAAIRTAGKRLVRSVTLFDLFRGGSLGPGRKSMAFHVELGANDRTLVDKDGAKFLKRLETGAAELGGELRKE